MLNVKSIAVALVSLALGILAGQWVPRLVDEYKHEQGYIRAVNCTESPTLNCTADTAKEE